MDIYEVGQITNYMKQLMEYDELLSDLWIRGEVCNFSRSSSGHIYFSLKDRESQIRCAMFKGSQRRLAAEVGNGLTILVHGRISFYEAQGTCQLYADAIQPEGVGLLYLQFEALKAKLESEGLFSAERKRQLPAYPRKIGLITSPTGAVLHDFLNVVGRRYPLVEIIVSPSAVQGETAPGEVIAALQNLNRYHESGGKLDLIVVARGGGSMEDLSAFNHEGLARAIFASTVPVVSAIGHETDFTIADYVADLRAPTPSAAAELVTPNVIDCKMQMADLRRRLVRGMQDGLMAWSSTLDSACRQLERHSPSARLDDRRHSLDDLMARGQRAMEHRLEISKGQVDGAGLRLHALSPFQTLERGYSICYDITKGVLVRSAAAVEPGDRLEIKTANGAFGSVASGQPDREDGR